MINYGVFRTNLFVQFVHRSCRIWT